jgi:hypothetical protein
MSTHQQASSEGRPTSVTSFIEVQPVSVWIRRDPISRVKLAGLLSTGLLKRICGNQGCQQARVLSMACLPACRQPKGEARLHCISHGSSAVNSCPGTGSLTVGNSHRARAARRWQAVQASGSGPVIVLSARWMWVACLGIVNKFVGRTEAIRSWKCDANQVHFNALQNQNQSKISEFRSPCTCSKQLLPGTAYDLCCTNRPHTVTHAEFEPAAPISLHVSPHRTLQSANVTSELHTCAGLQKHL